MRIATPGMIADKYFVSIYFEEIGRPFPVAIGGEWLHVGRGREYKGIVSMIEHEVDKNPDDIHILPPAIILAVVVSVTPTSKAKAREYMQKLKASRDAVELIRPSDTAIVGDMELAKEVVMGNDKVLQHLHVAEGKRKTFYGGKTN